MKSAAKQSMLLMHAILVVLGVGCAQYSDAESEQHMPNEAQDVQVVSQALASGFANGTDCTTQNGTALTYWSRGNAVDVCFRSPVPSAATQDLFEEFIESSWGVSANLDFVFHGTCPSATNSNWVSVYVDASSNAGSGRGIAAPGRGNRLASTGASGNACWAAVTPATGSFQVAVAAAEVNAASPSEEDIGIFRNASIHEFGHVLGFYHETGRSGQSTCGSAGSDSTGWLTDFDLYSVMSSCMGMIGGVQVETIEDWRNQYYFSPLDALGAEIRYPRAQTPNGRLWCGRGCIRTSSGVTIHGNSSQIANEWGARGAMNVSSSYVVGANTFAGNLLSGANVSNGSVVTNTANSSSGFNGGSRNWSGTVVESAGKYTALMMVSTGALVY